LLGGFCLDNMVKRNRRTATGHQETSMAAIQTLSATDDGVSALESLLSRLADVPTPAGPTPLQLRDTALVQIEAAD